jgi:hypothetical protein
VNLEGQAGKVPASSGRINFSPGFLKPPVLMLTAELKNGGTDPSRVSITTVTVDEATFVVESSTRVETIHWIASEAT